MIVHHGLATASGELSFEFVEEPLSTAEPLLTDNGRDIVRNHADATPRHLKRFVVNAQKSRTTSVGPAVPNRDDGWQFPVRGCEFLGNTRPERRMLDLSRGNIARMHLIGSSLMLPFLRRHRANDGDVLHSLSGLFPSLGNLDARDCGADRGRGSTIFRPWLRIESFKL